MHHRARDHSRDCSEIFSLSRQYDPKCIVRQGIILGIAQRAFSPYRHGYLILEEGQVEHICRRVSEINKDLSGLVGQDVNVGQITCHIGKLVANVWQKLHQTQNKVGSV